MKVVSVVCSGVQSSGSLFGEGGIMFRPGEGYELFSGVTLLVCIMAILIVLIRFI